MSAQRNTQLQPEQTTANLIARMDRVHARGPGDPGDLDLDDMLHLSEEFMRDHAPLDGRIRRVEAVVVSGVRVVVSLDLDTDVFHSRVTRCERYGYVYSHDFRRVREYLARTAPRVLHDYPEAG